MLHDVLVPAVGLSATSAEQLYVVGLVKPGLFLFSLYERVGKWASE